MIDAHGKLIRIGCYLGRGCVSASAVRSRRLIGQRIARQDGCDCGTNGNNQSVARKSRGINSLPFRSCGDGEDLRGSKHLPESLILDEIKRFAFAVVEFWKN